MDLQGWWCFFVWKQQEWICAEMPDKNGFGTEESSDLEVALTGMFWSACCSSAFLLGSGGVSMFLALFCRSKNAEGTASGGGNFGFSMVVLECIDSIPEALVVSQATVNGTIGWTFVLSVFFLNLVNTVASSLDILAQFENVWINRLLMSLLFFVVALLTSSISTDVYGAFDDRYLRGDWDGGHLALLVFGTLVGFLCVVALTLYEQKHAIPDWTYDRLLGLHRRISEEKVLHTQRMDRLGELIAQAQARACSSSAVITIFPTGGPLSLPTDGYVSFGSNESKTSTISANSPSDRPRSAAQVPTARFSLNGDVDGSESLSLLEGSTRSRRWSMDHGSDPGGLRDLESRMMFLNHQNLNLERGRRLIEGVLENLETAGMAGRRDPSPWVQDVASNMGNQVHSLLRSIGVRVGNPTTFAASIVPSVSFGRKALRLMGIMACVFLLSIGLVFGLTLLFHRFLYHRQNLRDHFEAFAQGLSGGAFLSTVAGTMIFRLQKDFYASEWKRSTCRTVAMLCYISGILTSSFLALLLPPSPE